MRNIELSFVSELMNNLSSNPQFIQVILGPRQVGKTTGIEQIMRKKDRQLPWFYFSSDEEIAPSSQWIGIKWQEVLVLSQGKPCVLVLDEIQRVADWSITVKKLWDAQKRGEKKNIRLVILGSSSLQIQNGLKESLAGRFELVRASHWNFSESRKLAGLDLEQFVEFGGYPGSYTLLRSPEKWQQYIRDSIIDAVIGKDILNLARVAKPALFRQSFEILMSYPAQEISYTKLLGQLQDRGNTDLIKHYIELFESAFLIHQISRYSPKAHLMRASSPKLIPLCGALINRSLFKSPEGYGRAFEACVGAALIKAQIKTSYWRQGAFEVDFIAEHEGQLFAIEVKSGRRKNQRGLEQFIKLHKSAKPVFITPTVIEKFLQSPADFLKLV